MKVRVIRTVKATNERLKEGKPFSLVQKYSPVGLKLEIDEKIRFQTHLGFGGAITESTTYTLAKEMTNEVRQEVLKAYFSSTEGLGYNLARIHMNSCDFSLGNYTYVKDHDDTLKSFDIGREDQWVIPFIHDAEKLSGKIQLLISPWSPPGWMKTNGEMNHGGQLLPKFYQTWANYYVKFIEALKQRKIDVTFLSIQNEPAAVQRWDSCIYSAEEERDFVKNYLGPTLEKTGHKDVKVLVWDHNRDIMIERVTPIYSDPKASAYVWGVGNHWYVSEAFENVGKVHQLFPDKHILFTEGCIEGGPQPGAWHTGERYARNIIGDFNNFSEGFIDWNLVLNEQGGPNHVGNYCDAPILADRKNNQLIYESSYYFIGQFSKFIRPQAQRIGLDLTVKDKIRAVAYQNKDQTIAIVVQNESDNDEKLTLVFHGLGQVVDLPAHSIETFIL